MFVLTYAYFSIFLSVYYNFMLAMIKKRKKIIEISRIDMREFQEGVVNHLCMKFLKKNSLYQHMCRHTPRLLNTNQKLPN